MQTVSTREVAAFFRTLNILDFDISPDEEEIVFSTNLNGHYNLWGMKIDRGYPYQLTTINQMTSFVKFHPTEPKLFTGFDQDGDENYHIYELPKSGGTPRPLLKVTNEKFYFGDISANGEHLYFTTSVGNPSFLNLGKIKIANGEYETLIQGEEGPYFLEAVSPDESTAAFIKEIGNTRQLGYILLQGQKLPVTPSEEKPHRVFGLKYWDADTLIFITNYESEFGYLASFQISTRTFKKLAAIEGREFSELALDRDRNQVYVVSERGVEDQLHQFDLSSNQMTQLEPPFNKISKLLVGAKGSLIALGQSARLPMNLYRYDAAQKKWQQLTDHRVMGVDPKDLTEPEVLNYLSYDGTEIEALLFVPKAEVDNGYTVLWPHGGPQHAETKSFRPLFQYLCSQGFRVFTPNFRGSTGYGEKFMSLVNKDWGGGPRKDIIAGMDWLDAQGKSDRKKWFCIGSSYGGYMTLLLHGRHADRFVAFVDMFGPSNLFTTIKTAPDHWKTADRELIGDPELDRDKLTEDSPMTYIHNMTQPMLVIQGVNDPRVVKEESDVIVRAMEERGKDVRYLVLPDEGHGFSKTENAIRVYQMVTSFLHNFVS